MQQGWPKGMNMLVSEKDWKKMLWCLLTVKPFQLADRASIWRKLIRHGIKNKVRTAIYYFCDHAKSCVKNGNNLSRYCTCNIGQGINLLMLLFPLYLNDFELFKGRVQANIYITTQRRGFLS